MYMNAAETIERHNRLLNIGSTMQTVFYEMFRGYRTL